MCELSDTHLLYERYITLQMTLLDGDGPFNYSTLMQSAVNTLNQAAEEEAAYPSSPSFAISFSLSHCYSLFLPLPLLLLYMPRCICGILLFILSSFWIYSPLLPLSESNANRHIPAS